MNQLLAVRELSFAYAKTRIFERLNLEVRQADTVAIFGPNGVGKTTLLKILCGLFVPTGGEVLLRNRPIRQHKRRELAQVIALVPQEAQVTFDFTVMELVEQGRTPYVGPLLGNLQEADRSAILRAMEMADVLPLAHRKFRQLSGGEKQRVKIALALAQEPEILLLDEPTQQLDIARQVEIFSVLSRLNDSGMTIIAAIHDLHSIYTHFSSVLLLRPDHSFASGPPSEVLTVEALLEVFGRSVPAAWLNGIPAAAHTRSSPQKTGCGA